MDQNHQAIFGAEHALCPLVKSQYLPQPDSNALPPIELAAISPHRNPRGGSTDVRKDEFPGFQRFDFRGRYFLLPAKLARKLQNEEDDGLSYEDENTNWRDACVKAAADAAEQNRAALAAAVASAAPATHPKAPKPTASRLVQVFDTQEVARCASKGKTADSDRKAALKRAFEAAGQNDGRREVPKFRRISSVTAELLAKFPNFHHAINGLAQDIALAASGKPDEFRIDPILLDGAPGIGKTLFSSSLAHALGIPFLKMNAGGLQHAAQLCGSASHWSNSRPGAIFDLLSESTNAVAVVLIDEVDKISDRSEYSIIPSLLELLEHNSSKKFKDESLQLQMDASKLIIVSTSNHIDRIDSALLSRCCVHSVDSPDAEQRLMIAVSAHNQLRRRTGRKIDIDHSVFTELATEVSDLRLLNRSVKSAFAKALIERKNISQPEWKRPERAAKNRIGF